MSKIQILFTEYGQSVWLDYIDRNLLIRGSLEELVRQGLRGVTSNPTIFHKAITGSTDYDDSIRDLIQADHTIDAKTLYQWLTVQDVQMTADILAPVYSSSEGADGFVSLEVSPHIAYDTEATIEAARHLWHAVDRPNLMIKVPATEAGLPAIEHLTAAGINVNVTLLFSVERYREVIQAYTRGLARNPEPHTVASVASFFVSRVDSKVDPLLTQIGTADALALQGRIAVANAKTAYHRFIESVASSSFIQQQQRGARKQRVLWGSTSTKNPEYSDVLYMNELIGADTINTVPPDTLDAFQAHGVLLPTLEQDIGTAQRELDTLESLGIDYAQVTSELECEGVQKFVDSYDQLLEALQQKRADVAESYAE